MNLRYIERDGKQILQMEREVGGCVFAHGVATGPMSVEMTKRYEWVDVPTVELEPEARETLEELWIEALEKVLGKITDPDVNPQLHALMPKGESDCGGNRPMDYISVEEHEAAEKALALKEHWDDLSEHEIVVLRSRARELGINQDVVFRDRLALIRCLFFHCENRNEWMEKANKPDLAPGIEWALRFLYNRFAEKKIVSAEALLIEAIKSGIKIKMEE